MRTKPKHGDTEQNSLERIWVNKTIDTLRFDKNDEYANNSISATLTFIRNAALKALRKGYVDVVAVPTYDEGDADNLSETHLEVNGWRLETDEEYRTRLMFLQSASKRNMENHSRQRVYYESKEFFERMTQLQEIIYKLK